MFKVYIHTTNSNYKVGFGVKVKLNVTLTHRLRVKRFTYVQIFSNGLGIE